MCHRENRRSQFETFLDFVFGDPDEVDSMSSEELRDEIALCGGDMDKIVELVQTDVHNAMGRNRREEARNIYQEYRERI